MSTSTFNPKRFFNFASHSTKNKTLTIKPKIRIIRISINKRIRLDAPRPLLIMIACFQDPVNQIRENIFNCLEFHILIVAYLIFKISKSVEQKNVLKFLSAQKNVFNASKPLFSFLKRKYLRRDLKPPLGHPPVHMMGGDCFSNLNKIQKTREN